MYNYNSLTDEILQYKRFLVYKYKTDEIVIKEIAKFLNDNNVSVITKEVSQMYARMNPNLSCNTIARNMGVFRDFAII